tara:strand:- start:610 stop:1401 length:792 start_codon:yes stop_codon:yes gene_type:complete
MMLFGLEGSGFIISLAITLLLTGLIMFYVRQRFSEMQENLDKLGQIVPVMTEQMNIHNMQIQEMRAGSVGATLTAAPPSEPLETIAEASEKIDVSDDDDDDDDDDSDDDEDDSDSDDESETNNDESSQIKNIQLGSEIGNDSGITVEEIVETDDTKVIDVDNLGVEEVDFDPPTESDSPGNGKLEVESLSDDDDDDDDDSEEEQTNADIVIKKIEASVEDKLETKPDFSKLSVAALRQKAASLENIEQDVTKMKKKELLKLFV